MAKSSDQASFAVNLEGNLEASARSGADAMATLRARIDTGVASLRDMNASLRNLKGENSEVVAAKKELEARILAERQALAKATAESLKYGNIQAKLSAQQAQLAARTKRVADEKERLQAKTKAVSSAISTAGGPVANLRDRFAALEAAMGEGGAGGGMSLLALGTAGAVAGVAALVAGLGAAAAAVLRFAVGSANAARSAGLLRTAAFGGGNEQWGKNFGDQVDALARKVPTGRAEINALGLSLARSRIDGQVWVDTLNLVTQASAAFGDEAGNTLKSFVERSKVWKRFRLNPLEMFGTGVEFDEVAREYANAMHIGIADARKALLNGRVTLENGAAALRAAVEKKFAKINIRQMLDLNVMAKKLGEAFDDLTRGIDLEPMLNALKEIAHMFDVNTVSGRSLKAILSVFGNEFVKGVVAATPIAKRFLWGLILGAMDITIAYLKTRNAIRDLISGDTIKRFTEWKGFTIAGRIAIYSLAAAVGTLGLVLAAAAAPAFAFALPFVLFGAAIWGVIEGVKALIDTDWAYFGRSIVAGIVGGITAAWTDLKGAINDLGDSLKRAFAERLRIHSPSLEFQELGAQLPAGVERGIEQGAASAQGAASGMVSASGGGAAGGSALAPRGGGARVEVHVHIHATGGGTVAAQVTAPSVIEQLTRAVVDACRQAGVPA